MLELLAFPDGQHLYVSEDFAPCGEVVKLSGVVNSVRPIPNGSVRLAGDDDLPAIWGLDWRASGSDRDRHQLLAALAELGHIYVHEGLTGGIDGFALHVHAGSTISIGPLVAPDDKVAYALVDPALQLGARLRVQTPRGFADPFVRSLFQCGLSAAAARSIRMVRGAPPAETPGAVVYALGRTG